jgi:phospholipase C
MAGVSWGFFEGDFNLSVTNASPNHFRSASRHLHRGAQRHGPRLPLLVISPWANKNYVDSTPTDQASIIRFIEDTFLSSARIGGGSFDATAGTLNNMFNFTNGATAPNPNVVLPNPTTGTVTTGN